jgi:hypothetical protein
MDGRVNGWTDGLMDRLMDGWKDRWTDGGMVCNIMNYYDMRFWECDKNVRKL